MADYNVQMKQYNGTSFDNILPYASQALTLTGGGGATEIIAQARAGLSQFATGSYVGTGVNSESSTPIEITFSFKPRLILVFRTTYNRVPDVASSQTGKQYRWLSANGQYMDSPTSSTYAAQWNRFVPDYFMWAEGMTKSSLVYEGSSGNSYSASAAYFIVSGNTFSVTIKKYNTSSSYEKFLAPVPSHIFNESGKTYAWVAFG